MIDVQAWRARAARRLAPFAVSPELVSLAAVVVAFSARTMWIVHRPGTAALHLPWWAQPFASPYPLMGLVFLAVTVVRAYTSSPASSSSASMIR